MKVVILAGGFGTRLSEYTENIPKPMVAIGNSPILIHLMNHYSHFGHNDFILALGYKANLVKQYFLNFYSTSSDFNVNLKTGDFTPYQTNCPDWSVSLIDTGLLTMTGGRLLRLKELIGNETFLLTYGDGLSNIDIDDLIKFHREHGKLITVSAVRPPARFGELDIHNGLVRSFKEKPQLQHGWINGGFFVVEPQFLDLIDDDSTMLERKPLEIAAQTNQLAAYCHHGFWKCMDTKRDHSMLEDLWKSGSAPWIINQ